MLSNFDCASFTCRMNNLHRKLALIATISQCLARKAFGQWLNQSSTVWKVSYCTVLKSHTEITYCNILYLNQHSAYSDTYCNTLYCLQHSLLSKQYQLTVLFWRYILSRVDICEGRVLSTCGGQLGVLLLERCHKIVTLCHTASSYTEERVCFHRGWWPPPCWWPPPWWWEALLVHLVVGCNAVMLLDRGGRRRRRRTASSEPLEWCSSPGPIRESEKVPLPPEVPLMTPGELEKAPLPRWAPSPSSLFSWCHRSASPFGDWPGGR